ncbi:MAG: protein containing domain [Parcubacteria group bacterium]|nr:protein containing domain [Parcubacteria group bacterium]
MKTAASKSPTEKKTSTKKTTKKSVKKSKWTPGGYSLLVKRSSAGLGLFAGEDIPKGKCVIEYVGRPVSKEEEYSSRSLYLFEISKTKTIDGKPKMNKAGYINHSCAANCEPEIHAGRVYIFSIKNIKAGDELGYDYGLDYYNDHIRPCKCAAKKHLYPNKK